ncbi:MAG TPA: 23S rRNA (pseudouridine(1915)-N(3))-methyltransferase RlmH [Burkholderiales bacterium]
MPRLSVLAVSARLPGWAEEACAEYARRMPKGYEVSRIAAKDEKRLVASLPKGARVIVLDERGRDCTTREFAELLKSEAAFVIGGPEGLSAKVKARAAVVLRVSSFTLPHALAQVVLLEQLYRAASLLIGHPYHRD